MSLLSFFKSKKEEVSLLLDIGNGTITGAFVLFSKTQKPTFLYSEQVPFTIPVTTNTTKLVDDMTSLLDNLLSDMNKKGFEHKYWKSNSRNIRKALVVFSSPWFMSKTKHINTSNSTPFIITKAFIDDIVKKEEDVFTKEIQKEGLKDSTDTFSVIEKSIVHTKINGYTLDNSIGKKTKDFDAFLCLAVMSTGIINKVESLILKHAHIYKDSILIHTFPLVSFTVIRDIFSSGSDFLIMDITGEVTDITLVQDDVIRKSVSVPSGRNFIIRQVAKKFSVSVEVAESMLNLYSSEKLDSKNIGSMEEVILDIEKEWSIYFENALSELSADMVLPSTLYLTTDSDVAPLYVSFLKLAKMDSTAVFRKNINLIQINLESLSSFYVGNSLVKVNEFIVMLSLFYKKIIN